MTSPPAPGEFASRCKLRRWVGGFIGLTPKSAAADMADAQASQETRLFTEVTDHRQAALTCLRALAIRVELSLLTRAQTKQSGGKLASSGATMPAQAARCGKLHVGAVRCRLGLVDDLSVGGDCSLRRTCTDTMAKWDDRPRTGDRQIRKPQTAGNHDPTGMVVVTPSARFRPQSLVP
jgi:hypothetical protein